MSSYKREYELAFRASDGFEKVLTQKADKLGLMIDFNITKSITSTPNMATIGITNPGPDTIATLQKEGVVSLKAGYEDDIALILSGDKQSAYYSSDGGTQRIELKVLEGVGGYKDLQISKNYSLGTTSLDIINDLVNFIIGAIPSVDSVDTYIIAHANVYIEPQVVFGQALDLLKKFLEPLRYEYFINNGVLQILPVNGFTRAFQVPVNSSTGMIGSPKPIMQTDKTKKARNGIEIQSILNYNFDIGRTILVNSKEINNEIFKIESVIFSGNSFDGDWISNIKAYEIDNAI